MAYAICSGRSLGLNGLRGSVAARSVSAQELRARSAVKPMAGIARREHKSRLAWRGERHLLALGLGLTGDVIILIGLLFAFRILEF